MEDTAPRAIAIVGVGGILPDAPDTRSFWENLEGARYSVSEVAPDRWDPGLYYDPDPRAPDKTYSKIGAFVRRYEWDPLQWKIGGIPPRVSDAMDETQKWAVACTRAALADYGFPSRPLDQERTAVILGNAMAGERHYVTSMRICLPEVERELTRTSAFSSLPGAVRTALADELHSSLRRRFPPITEDTMPGELANCMAGRVANLFNLRGPNFVCDAACASAMAAISAAIEGLVERDYDAALTGGIDRNMGVATYVKFCKIGALSATGTRPYADGADGFVMGEGAVVFLLKRLEDAERDEDRIYAVIRGIGGASDGKGKGITAPNPVGQKLAIERAWRNAGLDPRTCSFVEGHGTSTRVGDVVEVESLIEGFGNGGGLAPRSIRLGSVKSNIGHLKGAAGAAGLLKAVFALHHKRVPASLNFRAPNPSIDFAHAPFYVNGEVEDWAVPSCGVRRAGVSAFGFGGTNFHTVLEEHVPGRLGGDRRSRVSVAAPPIADGPGTGGSLKPPLRGALVVGASSVGGLAARLRQVEDAASAREASLLGPPSAGDLAAPLRIAIDYAGPAELAEKAKRAAKALAGEQPGAWKALRAQGIFRGRGPAAKVAFLFTGQGSQYVNMLRTLRDDEPIVRAAFAEADAVMTPLLGKPLTSYLFVDPDDAGAVAAAEESLKQTAVTQPAVLATDVALARLLAAYGVRPDMVMGHSLGEYAALVAAGVLSFADALTAVSARGREMSRVSVEDNGRMAAVLAPVAEIERVLRTVDGYVVVANHNSATQAVVGGASAAVEAAVRAFKADGINVVPLSVSHAFHTRIVAPASGPLRQVLDRLDVRPPALPVVANVTGELYPMGAGARPEVLDILARQVASPVQFVKGLRSLRAAGASVFVEVGPKKALQGFVEDAFAEDPEVVALFTNHPKLTDAVAFNQALTGLYAAGRGAGRADARPEVLTMTSDTAHDAIPSSPPGPHSGDTYSELGHLLADFLDRSAAVHFGRAPRAAVPGEAVVITGAGLGLPGLPRVFDDGNVGRILRGEQLIEAVPAGLREAMARKRVVRLVKSEEGEHRFESIDDVAGVIKLAARGGALDLEREFGVSAERVAALDTVTKLAIGSGLEALRDAGVPLVLRYKTTTRGTRLPDRWMLPESLRDETGVIFASAFPGLDSFADVLSGSHRDRFRRDRLAELRDLRARAGEAGDAVLVAEIDGRIADLEALLSRDGFVFDRRFLFRVLSMGHSQFAEHVGARGPNTQVNAACASTTQAVSIAEDWIRAGRCRRVVVISGDDVTSDHLMEWIGAGFLASGAAATDERVEEAALPFDRRRHGMIVGMGAAALVVESAEAARERGLLPICEVLAAVSANSAFHGTRLDLNHIGQVMEALVSQAESRFGIRRDEMAPETVFLSHETYTPARGGSASAEVHALRQVFGDGADRIVMANTKGFTGHPMGVGIEDVVAAKALETGLVPPIPNFKEVDPELGILNLSKGGSCPMRYALRLSAGFGSQIGLSLLRWVPPADGRRRAPEELGFAYRIADPAAWRSWLGRISGQEGPEVEVVQRTLRVRDRERPMQAAPPSLAVATAGAAAATLSEPCPAPQADPVKDRILELVAQKTGYPTDMLGLDLDLEADLGIDTVKQAELFAAVREEWGIPRDENRKLRDFPTLSHVIGLVHAKRPDLAGEPAVSPSPPTSSEAPAPPAAPSAGPAPVPADPVRDRILALVADKTGYPTDMLDLDLDLEADLGIDTVKQAELFAAVREEWGIPRDENRKLRDYPTLRHVVDFVNAMRSDRPEETAAPPEAEAPAAETTPADLASADRVPRRAVVPVVRPPLRLSKPTGATLEAGRRVLVVADQGGLAKALVRRLQRLGVTVLAVDPVREAEPLESRLDAWLRQGPVHGVYWLPAADAEGDFLAMDLGAWRKALRLRVKLLHRTMRALYDQVAARGTFLVAATRMGGLHGCDAAGAVAPLGGAVSGFLKAYKRERPDALVKVVDFEPSRKTAEFADLLVDETLRDPGAVEVGHRDGLRFSLALAERPAADGAPGMTLGRDSVFVVTGAAGAIVSAIVADLAAASGGTFHLLDLVPEPDPANPDLVRLGADREALKRELFERRKAGGERATPATIEKELAALDRAASALAAIAAIRRAGGTAHYESVDLRDGAAVRRACEAIRDRSGRVDVLLHGAGLEVSRRLSDKGPDEFDLVFDVKADGWFNVLRGLLDAPLGAAVAFSSIAGRFGNSGQADYSAANDLLCKTTSSFRTIRPGLRGIAIDWTAWGDIGMATRGSIPRIMEEAGIDMLPAACGVPVIRRELTAGGARGEIVIAGRLGIFQKEWDETGGLETVALAARAAMIGAVKGYGVQEGLRIETVLDPPKQPFLNDHRIDGTPVLPGVMGIESFAEASALLLPEWRVADVERIDFHAPFKFFRDEPRVVELRVVLRPDGRDVVAECRLQGSRTLPGQTTAQVTTHFTAEVRLTAAPPEVRAEPVPARAAAKAVSPEDIYRVYFHGPAYRVLEGAWRADGEAVGLLSHELPPDHTPPGRQLLMAPRLIELCFQTAGIFEMGTRGRMGLPLHVSKVAVLRPPEEAHGERLFAVVKPSREDEPVYDARVVDEDGNVYVEMTGYRTVELPGGVDAARLEPFRSAMS